jgi:hypothetical protein
MTETNEQARAMVEALNRCKAVAEWAGILAALRDPEAEHLDTLGRAIHADAAAAGLHFEAAGAPSRADAIAPAAGIGALLTKIAPVVGELSSRELDALAMVIIKAADDATRHAVLAGGPELEALAGALVRASTPGPLSLTGAALATPAQGRA